MGCFMILILAAVFLGSIVGILGYYFSKTANVFSLGIIGVGFVAIETMETLPEHAQIAVVLFAVSFFGVRIVTWFLRQNVCEVGFD